MEILRKSFTITFDYDIDDLLYMEIKSKGCLLEVLITIKNGIKFILNFYDPIRLKQEIDDELNTYNFFYEENVVVIKEIVIEEILVAVDNIVTNKIYERMILCK